MINFGNNLEEFIKDFKERVVENACCNYPKDYRKSDKYLEQNLDEKFNDTCDKLFDYIEHQIEYINAIK